MNYRVVFAPAKSFLFVWLLTLGTATAQFVAFNDHAPGAGTAANTTTWNVFGDAPGSSGPLKNISTGANLPVTLTITRSASGVTPAASQGSPSPGTPLYNTFNGFVDFEGSPNPSVEVAGGVVTYTFTGLDPAKRYSFKGSSVRGNPAYTDRWTLFQITGADAFTSAHTANALTTTQVPAITTSQVAINVGVNSTATTGDMAVWENINPGPDGSFAVTSQQYTGTVPGGSSGGSKGYALTGFRLEEFNITSMPVAITSQPQDQTVGELQSATFIVSASGNPPPTYQWHKNDVPIAGATSSSYTLATAPLSDDGARFKVVVVNTINSVTSSSALLHVVPDTSAPVLVGASTLSANQVQVKFSEPIQASTAMNVANFTITSPIGNLIISNATLAASLTNVILVTSAQTEGVVYTVTVNGIRDISTAGNLIAPNSQTTFGAVAYAPADIGNPAVPGTVTPVAGGYNVTAAGADVGGANDQFSFAFQQRTGDFDVKVRIEALDLSDAWAKAGLMARETLDANSRFAAVFATPSISGALFQSRSIAGGNATITGNFPVNYPATWLRLKRVGSVFMGFAGFDGENWSQLGSATITMPSTIYFGFATASHDATRTTTARFRDIADVISAGTAATPPLIEPLGPSSRATGLVITEIMYHPPERADGKKLEFVELFNSHFLDEDLSGYRLTGEISYTFPVGTVLRAGAFLVIAQVPADVQQVYGIANVIGPFVGRFQNGTGTVRLRNNLGAQFLAASYGSKYPWPASADGAGHSLVLARPSYGEGDVRAWTASDRVGGSPGRMDGATYDALRNVVINEFLAHTDDPELDFIELYNHSNQSVDISGCFLSDDPNTNKFAIPPNTTIPARGFYSVNQSTLGFALAAEGETIHFRDRDNSRVIDAIRFDGQENGISSGRYPDGSPNIYRLNSKTPGLLNTGILAPNIVINEIMYNPISGLDDDEYVELYNRGVTSMNLGGWRFIDGIDFTFPSNTLIAANGYLVVGKNISRLLANYPNLNANNTVGNYDGNLSNGGERLALARPDQIVTTNSSGILRTNTIYIVVNEMSYGEGGRWGQWADGGGSSLELIDARSDNHLASNWGDSDETAKAPWTNIEFTGALDNGQVGASGINELHVMLLGGGECLIDNVEVVGGGTNYVPSANSTFESSINWIIQGNHVRSSVRTTEGFASSRSFQIRATSGGDNGANRIEVNLAGALTAGSTATIRTKARWLRGQPDLLLRLYGNYLEASGRMTVPGNLGTPGAANSRAASNVGPAIYDVTHAPVLPAGGQPVVVACRVHDPDGISSFVVTYRVDPSGAPSNVTMTDNGTGGDAVAGDGIYSGTIPGQASGTLAAFYVQATDALGATSRFPSDAPARECLVRFGETMPYGNLGTYRLWMTASKINTWTSREKLSNEPLDGTFVYGDFRVIYNSAARYRGSPFIRPGYSSPTSGAVAYVFDLPDDDRLLGSDELNLDSLEPGKDETSQREQLCFWIAGQLGVSFSRERHINLIINGVNNRNRGVPVYSDSQQPNGEYMSVWFPDDDDGEIFKIDDWFEFNDSVDREFNIDATLQRFTTTGGALKQARYRWNWEKKAHRTLNDDYSSLFALVNAVNSGASGTFTANVEALADIDEWMRVFAVRHIAGDWDGYGYNRGKNMFAYKPRNEKWKMVLWDMDFALGDGDGTSTGLFNSIGSDTGLQNLYNHPPFRRAYWRAMSDAVNGPLLNSRTDPILDATYTNFLANGITPTAPAVVKSYISGRRSYIISQLATVAASFAITSNGGNNFSTNNNLVTLSGTAPVGVKTIEVNSISYPLTWSTVTSWTLRVPIAAGANLLTVQGYDTYGNPVAGASDTITVNNTGASAQPQGYVVINEIMYNPAVPNAAFIEFHNAHPSVTFDLSNWRLEGADFTFTEGTIILPNSFLVIANNAAVFAAMYGSTILLAGEFAGQLDNGGETLTLIKPGATPDQDQVIDQVRYDDDAPWPVGADGFGPSLQLIDPTQDNYRVANWAAANTNGPPPYSTPGSVNSVRATLTAFPPVWINEVLTINTTGITDNFGEREPWLELHNNGPTSVSLNGFYLTDNFTNLTGWAFPATATINAGEFLLVWLDGEPGETAGANYHTNFRLTNSLGSLALVRIDSGRTEVLDYVNFFGLTPNRSFGSYPDGQPQARQIFHFVTPRGANNAASAPVSVVIDEWMAANVPPNGFNDRPDGQFEDWFELYNPNASVVDLSGYFLTDTLTDKTKWQIPPNTFVPAQGHLLVWADNGSGTVKPGDLQASFRLNDNGEAIGLFAPDGTPQSTVTFGPQIPNVSEGRWPSGQPGTNYYLMTTFTPRAANVVNAANTLPILALIGNKVVNEGTTLSFTATASDSDTPAQTLHFSLDPGAPAGASINQNNGVFTWTPSEAQGPGVFSVTVRVTDNGVPNLSDSETITITVGEVNSVPILAPIGNKTVNEGSLLTFAASASDPDLPAQSLAYSLDPGAPAGASISAGGVFSWTPTESQGPGTYPVTVRVTDNGSPNLGDSQTIIISVGEVNSAPVLAPISNQAVNEGSLLTFTVSASDSDLPAQGLSFSLDPGAPTGANINASSGVFTWTPGESQGPGTITVTIRVTDNASSPLSDAKTITIVVSEVNSTPVLSPIGAKSVKEGVLLTFAATATDPDIPTQTLTYSLDPGAPAGTAINSSSGVFTWTPTPSQGPSTNSVTIRVTDSGSPIASAAETITIVVTEGNAPPVLAPIGSKTVNEGSLLTFAATATDPDVPAQTLTFSLGAGAPAGANVTTGGVFTWTPTEAQGPGTYNATIIVTDNGVPPASASQTITIAVSEVNGAPVLLPIGNKTVNENTLLTFTPTATDADAPAQALIFSLDTNAPAGATINATTGVFTWTPGESFGSTTNLVTIRVMDGGTPNLSASETIQIVVNETNDRPVLTPIGDKTVNEGSFLTFTVSATDADLPAQTLIYSLDPGAPGGATLNPNTGLFAWIPAEDQGPGNYNVTIRVTDSGTASQSAFETITITVNEVNTAPVLAPISDKTAVVGTPLTFTASASDADLPPQKLTFTLDPGAPAGATIDGASGLFTWTPGPTQGPGTTSIAVRVTDNALPALSQAQSFTVVVQGGSGFSATATVANNVTTIGWQSIPGKTYQVQFRTSLGGGSWQPLGVNLIATGTASFVTDTLSTTQRFYRVLRLD